MNINNNMPAHNADTYGVENHAAAMARPIPSAGYIQQPTPEQAHIPFTASCAPRVFECPASLMFEQYSREKDRDYANEGSKAHEVAAHRLNAALGNAVIPPANADKEMKKCADKYADYVVKLVKYYENQGKAPIVLVEQPLRLPSEAEHISCKADCIIMTKHELCIIEYKYGKGKNVSATGNPQLMLYALGAIQSLRDTQDVCTIYMAVFQPRKSHIDTSTMTRDELNNWANTDLHNTIALADTGQGGFHCGEHCQYCEARSVCRERAISNMLFPPEFEAGKAPNLTDAEIENIIQKYPSWKKWMEDIMRYAFQRALEGKKWAGYKLVRRKKHRCFRDKNAVIDTVFKAGYDPFQRKILTVRSMENMLGKELFSKLVTGYVEYPKGEPELVPDDDKRPEI